MKSNRKFPVIRQEALNDCGAACLVSLVAYYGGNLPLELAREICNTQLSGTTLQGLAQGAATLGFLSEGYQVKALEKIDHSMLPLILLCKNKTGADHYIVLTGIQSCDQIRYFSIMDPSLGLCSYSEFQLRQCWVSGICLHIFPSLNYSPYRLSVRKKISWIRELLGDLFSPFLLLIFSGALIAGMNGLLTLSIQRIVDAFIPGKAMHQLQATFLLLLLILISKELFTRLRTEFILRQTAFFNKRLFGWFCKRLIQLPIFYFEKRQVGDFMVRFRDAQKIQQVVFALASHVIIDLLFILVIFFLVFLYEWRIGLVLVVFTPVYFFWMVRRANALSACQINRIKNATSFEQQFIAVISSIQTYKMYGKEELAALNLQLKQELFQDADKGYRTALARLAFVSGIFVVPVMLLVTYMASFAAISGRISTGEFVALVGFVSFLFPVLTSLASFSVPMKEASIAFNRLYEFHLTHAGMRKQQTHIKEFRSIRLEDVIIMGKQAKPVAERLNFFLPTTGFISVVGENGTGKTRLLQVLSKCSETYEGIIRVNEQHNLCDLSFSSWMDLVAIVPQEIVLFTGTIVENIAFDNTAISKGKITEMLTRYDLHHYFDTFPAALETIIGAEGMPVSGGQKQIIGLARALFKNPAVLLLDEVTAALDAEREKQVVELLFRLKQEILIICVSHKNETICNRSDLIIQL